MGSISGLPSSVESSSTARRWKYDAFLCFRGVDTRRGFTTSLYHWLQNKGIRAFMDGPGLAVGDVISYALLQAIEGSRFAIVVLSQNFASSSSCLEELTKICQLMEVGHIILPVFYDVDPNDVRHQKGSFGEAFSLHERSGRHRAEKFQQWRKDLTKVANLSAELCTRNYRTDLDLVEHIVEEVCRQVKPVVETNKEDFETKKQKRGIMASISQKTAASLTSSAEPSSTAHRWEYDVFLSFRGRDTRRGFTPYLYDWLQKRSITTFMDVEGLEVGDGISPNLLKAIEGSRFAIIVLSVNYGSSPWCLEELTKIYQFMEDGSRILPVFYDVHPSDVRHQTGDFGKDFSWYESSGRHIAEKVQQWREALTKLASLSGWIAQNYISDIDLIKAIVESVYSRLQPVVVSQSPDLITGKPKLTVTSWSKGNLLGSGSFGFVYAAIAEGGYFIAVKEVSLLDQGSLGRQRVSQLEQEIALLSQFEHENIVQYYGTQKDESNLYIFLELVTEGSLQKLYEKFTLTDSHVSVYTRQILQGLKYLHDQNVIHRDIKCANILVHANGSVKLADFGLAKIMKTNNIQSCKGTTYWMAPEVVRCTSSQGYGLPADIWSLGCTVLEMLTGMLPYPTLEWQQAFWRIGSGELPLVPDSLSIEAQDFIHLCLKVKPDDQLTAAKLLEHPFVNKHTSSGSAH